MILINITYYNYIIVILFTGVFDERSSVKKFDLLGNMGSVKYGVRTSTLELLNASRQASVQSPHHATRH